MYDLAIMHVVDAGPDLGKRVRLTRKAEAGEIGHDLVFEFRDRADLQDFIDQLNSIKIDAWGKAHRVLWDDANG